MTVAYEQDWCHGIPTSEPKIELSIEEAQYALKCIRYLASGCDIHIDKKSNDEMVKFADVLYERVKKLEKVDE